MEKLNIDRLVEDFKEATNGLVSRGITSLEVDGGVYELHMKKYHVGEYGGLNIFSAKELNSKYYEWLTLEQVSDMLALQEFPLNLRTLYRGKEGLYILEDTYMFIGDILLEEDLRAIIADDFKMLERGFK